MVEKKAELPAEILKVSEKSPKRRGPNDAKYKKNLSTIVKSYIWKRLDYSRLSKLTFFNF